jgi:hypothetical protein
MSTIKRFRPIFLSFFVLAQVYSQDPGMPFIRNYPAYEYRASQQNWAIAQDSRGIMYFGNNNGLLEYDGISWRLTKLPGVRALAIDKTGRIYTGLENDFGYLEPTRDGSYVYHSLKEKLAESDRDLTTVFRVFIISRLLSGTGSTSANLARDYFVFMATASGLLTGVKGLLLNGSMSCCLTGLMRS